jgi:uncharacterized protein (DUF2252 family)
VKRDRSPSTSERAAILIERRNQKMARSAHAYVRGSTVKFYEWLETTEGHALPEGPPVWICGDCHLGNLGPLANTDGDVEIGIRDLDQTVIGNPAHDLIRLGLSLAMAARGSDLPGVTTAHMLEELVLGYEQALSADDDDENPMTPPETVTFTMRRALGRKWKHLARERIEDTTPTIPLGRKFWTLSKQERGPLEALFESKSVRKLVTSLNSRDDDAPIEFVDAAYWIKGCSSLGRARYSVLLRVGRVDTDNGGLCLIDIKEALEAAAPRAPEAEMPLDHGERVVEGARALSPNLGERMLASSIGSTPVVVRELMPQDLKLEIERLTRAEANKAARYLGWTVGKAHGRQMDKSTQRAWRKDLARNRSLGLEAPSWLWRSVVALIATHETGYLEHCRRFALAAAERA